MPGTRLLKVFLPESILTTDDKKTCKCHNKIHEQQTDFCGILSNENRWVKLINLLPRHEMVSVYLKRKYYLDFVKAMIKETS